MFLLIGESFLWTEKQIEKISKNKNLKKFFWEKYNLNETPFNQIEGDLLNIDIFQTKKLIIFTNCIFLYKPEKSVQSSDDINSFLKFIEKFYHDYEIIIAVPKLKFIQTETFKKLKPLCHVLQQQTLTKENTFEFIDSFCKKNKIEINNEVKKFLFNFLPKNLDILLNELVKIMYFYDDSTKEITLEMAKKIICYYPYDDSQKLLFYLLKKNKAKTIEIIQKVKELNIKPLYLLFNLYKQWKTIFQLKVLLQKNKSLEYISKVLFISVSELKDFSLEIKNFSLQDLFFIRNLIIEIEEEERQNESLSKNYKFNSLNLFIIKQYLNG